MEDICLHFFHQETFPKRWCCNVILLNSQMWVIQLEWTVVGRQFAVTNTCVLFAEYYLEWIRNIVRVLSSIWPIIHGMKLSIHNHLNWVSFCHMVKISAWYGNVITGARSTIKLCSYVFFACFRYRIDGDKAILHEHIIPKQEDRHTHSARDVDTSHPNNVHKH